MPEKKKSSTKTLQSKKDTCQKPSRSISSKSASQAKKESALDFDETLSKDLCHPSVWEAHQDLLALIDPSDSRLNVDTSEEGSGNLDCFFRDLRLADLRKALESSPKLLTHPLILEQIRMWSQMTTGITVEKLAFLHQELQEVMEKLNDRGADYHSVMYTPEIREQAQDSLAYLGQLLIQQFFPGYELRPKERAHRKPGAPGVFRLQHVDDFTLAPLPARDVIPDAYRFVCEEFDGKFAQWISFENPSPEVIKRFWRWDKKRETRAKFIDRIGSFLQGLWSDSLHWDSYILETAPEIHNDAIAQEIIEAMIHYATRKGTTARANPTRLCYMLCAYGYLRRKETLSIDELIQQAESCRGILQRNT